jgi:hypothetical protein
VRARVTGVYRALAVPAEEFDPARALPGWFAGDPPAEFLPLLEEMAADVRPESLRAALLVMSEADQRDLLPRISVPTLLIVRPSRRLAGAPRIPEAGACSFSNAGTGVASGTTAGTCRQNVRPSLPVATLRL